MRCAEVREALPAHVRDGDSLLEVRRHLAGCDGCSAELARYASLLEGLHALREHPVEPPAGLLARLVEIPLQETRLDAVRDHVARHRKRYVGGLALVAGVVGAAALRSRSRRLAPA